jgi:menaquinone-dependent protoporphyrinogen oxidase
MAGALIAYGIAEGQTAKISEYIAQIIRDRGHDADAVDAEELPSASPLENYEAVMIIGASNLRTRGARRDMGRGGTLCCRSSTN